MATRAPLAPLKDAVAAVIQPRAHAIRRRSPLHRCRQTAAPPMTRLQRSFRSTAGVSPSGEPWAASTAREKTAPSVSAAGSSRRKGTAAARQGTRPCRPRSMPGEEATKQLIRSWQSVAQRLSSSLRKELDALVIGAAALEQPRGCRPRQPRSRPACCNSSAARTWRGPASPAGAAQPAAHPGACRGTLRSTGTRVVSTRVCDADARGATRMCARLRRACPRRRSAHQASSLCLAGRCPSPAQHTRGRTARRSAVAQRVRTARARATCPRINLLRPGSRRAPVHQAAALLRVQPLGAAWRADPHVRRRRRSGCPAAAAHRRQRARRAPCGARPSAACLRESEARSRQRASRRAAGRLA